MRPVARSPKTRAPYLGLAAHKALCALAGLVASVALGACGTSVQQHQARYLTGLRAVDASFTDSVHRLLASVTPSAPRSPTARAVGRFELQLADVETHLRRLRAPAAVARKHRHLVRAIDHYATGLRLEVQALRSAGARKLALTGQRMLADTHTLSSDVSSTIGSIEQILGSSGGPSGA